MSQYAKIFAVKEEEPDSDLDFICYPVGCVFCENKYMSSLSDDGDRHQTCGKCKKSFYAPDYYILVDRKLVRKTT